LKVYWIIGAFLVLQFCSLQFLKVRIKKREQKFAIKYVRYSTIGGFLAGLVGSIVAQATILQSIFISLFSGLYFYLSYSSIFRKQLIVENKTEKSRKILKK
jgi:FtsH-binding integral membrane protein